MVVLLIGVLAMFALVETGMSSTRATTAREQGTNLARDLVERSRQVAYTSMTSAGAPDQLRGKLPDAGALSGSSFTVTRRNVTYTVTITACSIDDPTDGIGVGTSDFCAAPTGTVDRNDVDQRLRTARPARAVRRRGAFTSYPSAR